MSRKFRFNSSKPKGGVRLFSCAGEILDTGLVRSPHTEIFSNREIVVDGCSGVFEYNECYIRLKLSKGSLILCGSDFDISHFENCVITVRGKLSSIEFCV